jgi:hypothetical protein
VPSGVPQSARHARGNRHSSPGADLEPLSRRALQAAGVLSLLLILVVANSLLNGGEESPFNPNPVAAAAQRTEQVQGMRFEMTMRFTTESAPPTTLSGSGAYNGQTNLLSAVYRAPGPQGAPMAFDAVLGEDGWFFRYPQLASRMPEGKEWVKVEGLPGQSDESKVSESPESSLQILSAAGDVQRSGQLRVRGVQTTRYRATLSAGGVVASLRSQGKDELADQLEGVTLAGPMHAEVLVDRDGILRRIHTVATVVTEGKALTTDTRMDLFDFGIEPDVQVPDDSRVLDITPLLEAKLDALGQAG